MLHRIEKTVTNFYNNCKPLMPMEFLGEREVPVSSSDQCVVEIHDAVTYKSYRGADIFQWHLLYAKLGE